MRILNYVTGILKNFDGQCEEQCLRRHEKNEIILKPHRKNIVTYFFFFFLSFIHHIMLMMLSGVCSGILYLWNAISPMYIIKCCLLGAFYLPYAVWHILYQFTKSNNYCVYYFSLFSPINPHEKCLEIPFCGDDSSSVVYF